MATTTFRNPRAEAQEIVGPSRRAHVLEPSPPTVGPPDHADDPAVPDPADDRPSVMPTSAGELTWDELARTDPQVAVFARERWLGAWAPLPPVPPGLVATRKDLHRVAYSVVAEARRLANGRFGLRFTRGGFGTPFFGADEQVRVEGDVLVRQRGGDAFARRLTTLRDAARHVGVEPGTTAAEHDSPPLGDLDRALSVDPVAAAFLGGWFGFATSVLEELRLTPGAREVGRVQLWPGHFDPAIEMGDAETGGRATFGASPGDDTHREPYLYVAPWSDVDDGAFWNAGAFGGAELGYRRLLAADDARAAALSFLREGHERIAVRAGRAGSGG